MEEIFINTIQDFNDYQGVETLHPLVSVVHVENTEHIKECVMHYGLYAIYLKENKGCKLSYGRTPYDFDEMTVTSFAPGQVVKVEPNPEVPFAKFTALVFHPDLLNRTALGRQINRYEFFGYSSTEALHLSAQEVEVFRGVLAMIEQELHRAIDKHTRELIVSNIELLLNYCLRFYDRQFITREEINHTVVKKFIELLDDYISTKALRDGLPTVAYFADKCCLSSGYFGNLVRVETGRTAKDIISDHLLAHAKQLLNDDTLTITMISERMGFDYPQHFVRFFKSHTGKTPSAYRNERRGFQSPVMFTDFIVIFCPVVLL
ncbi:MAG: helix-turn-helix transcriptional regulator [Bacteroidales bacterium]|nr:helix-turn-helix transcriptional regulator [Bacteroidales bacterium]